LITSFHARTGMFSWQESQFLPAGDGPAFPCFRRLGRKGLQKKASKCSGLVTMRVWKALSRSRGPVAFCPKSKKEFKGVVTNTKVVGIVVHAGSPSSRRSLWSDTCKPYRTATTILIATWPGERLTRCYQRLHHPNPQNRLGLPEPGMTPAVSYDSRTKRCHIRCNKSSKLRVAGVPLSRAIW